MIMIEEEMLLKADLDQTKEMVCPNFDFHNE